MPSNNSKYTPEFREKVVRFIMESGKSATSVSEEMGLDKNTVCRWVRDYRRAQGMPTYAEEKHLNNTKSKKERDYKRELKAKTKRIQELEEEVEILKKSLRIFMQPPK